MLTFNFSDFERMARDLEHAEDQMKFAIANALTSAAFRARELLITDTWPAHVEVRNRMLLRTALRVERARKNNLRVAIVDTLGRANLLAHAKGGTARPHGRRFAIPPKGTVRRTAHGVTQSQRPRAIIASTPKRALRITPRGIFVGEGGRLHLRYAFATSAHIKKDVPFFEDFERYMREEIKRTFPIAMKKAMQTRRKR